MGLFPLSSRKNIYLCFLNLQLDKLCVSLIVSLEYSRANKVTMSTKASVTLQRKKLGERQGRNATGTFRIRESRSSLPYEQDMSLFQSHMPVQSRRDLQLAVFGIMAARQERTVPSHFGPFCQTRGSVHKLATYSSPDVTQPFLSCHLPGQPFCLCHGFFLLSHQV